MVTPFPWRGRRLADRIGGRSPFLLAPMAGAGGVDLAIAAMRGGFVGALPCATIALDEAERQLARVRAAIDGPVNLNFFCHAAPPPHDDGPWRALLAPYFAEYGVGPPTSPPTPRRAFDADACALVERTRPEIVSFHFGLPAPDLLRRVRATRALILASATTPAEAHWLVAQGIDAVIAQGWEAGGHSGRFLPADPSSRLTTATLVRLLAETIGMPVIAAGGIADAAGVAAMAMLGAAGVQIGTAFLAAPESLVSANHRTLLGTGAETVVTTLFSGRPARGFATRLTRELGPVRTEVPPFPYGGDALAELRRAAPEHFANMWAGQAAALARAEPAEAIARALTTDAASAMLAR